jgi:hypothetical protein
MVLLSGAQSRPLSVRSKDVVDPFATGSFSSTVDFQSYKKTTRKKEPVQELERSFQICCKAEGMCRNDDIVSVWCEAGLL